MPLSRRMTRSLVRRHLCPVRLTGFVMGVTSVVRDGCMARWVHTLVGVFADGARFRGWGPFLEGWGLSASAGFEFVAPLADLVLAGFLHRHRRVRDRVASQVLDDEPLGFDPVLGVAPACDHSAVGVEVGADDPVSVVAVGGDDLYPDGGYGFGEVRWWFHAVTRPIVGVGATCQP